MNTLTFPLPLFQNLLRLMLEDRQRPLFIRAGCLDSSDGREWLAREIMVSPQKPFTEDDALISVSFLPLPLPLPAIGALPSPLVGHLYLGEGAWRGQAWGFARGREGIEPLVYLSLTGAGMHKIKVQFPFAEKINPAQDALLPPSVNQRWSRTIGALGGLEIWQRLKQLKVAVIGCGRTGSLIASTLARTGLSHLTLIDADKVELHNLGEMDAVTDNDIGLNKAEALALNLRQQLSAAPLSIQPVVVSVFDRISIEAIKNCEVIFSCVDNDAARLATTVIATLYHKVLIDTGTGIFQQADALDKTKHSQTMGADVRLILPGDGCLLCRGNLADYAQAIDDLCNHRSPEMLNARRGDWRRERAGSLRTLNQLAAALAVQMLQDLVAEHIQNSMWAQIEFNQVGESSIAYPSLQTNQQTSCSLCAKAGIGDEGFSWHGR